VTINTAKYPYFIKEKSIGQHGPTGERDLCCINYIASFSVGITKKIPGSIKIIRGLFGCCRARKCAV
jgi:hypothetical protein